MARSHRAARDPMSATDRRVHGQQYAQPQFVDVAGRRIRHSDRGRGRRRGRAGARLLCGSPRELGGATRPRWRPAAAGSRRSTCRATANPPWTSARARWTSWPQSCSATWTPSASRGRISSGTRWARPSASCWPTARPARVRSLMLVGPAGIGQKINADFIRGLVMAPQPRGARAAASAAVCRSFARDRTNCCAQLVAYKQRAGRRRGAREDRVEPLRRHAVGRPAARRGRRRADAGDLGCRRRDDSAAGARGVRARGRRRCTCCRGCGHMVQVEAADEVNRLIDDFLRSLSAGRCRARLQGRLRPSLSWLVTQSPASTALPSETSPASTTAATISASRSALPWP